MDSLLVNLGWGGAGTTLARIAAGDNACTFAVRHARKRGDIPELPPAVRAVPMLKQGLMRKESRQMVTG
jgi:hypothetical protein